MNFKAFEGADKQPLQLTKGAHDLEKEVQRNKGFWVEKPQNSAPLTFKLNANYTVDIPKKLKKEQGIFHRPNFLELDFVVKLANAGLLYSDEEISESEEEMEPDTTFCQPLRKIRYKICDPCKVKPGEKEAPTDLLLKQADEISEKEERVFQKGSAECKCDFCSKNCLESHAKESSFDNVMELLRKNKMNKTRKPFKSELLNKNYESRPPVKFMPYQFGMKRTFPMYFTSNL